MLRNHWPECSGLGGRLQTESVAGLARNTHSSPFDPPLKEKELLRGNKTESLPVLCDVESSTRPERTLHVVQGKDQSSSTQEDRLACFQAHLDEIDPGIRPPMGGKLKAFAGQISPHVQDEIFRGVLRDISNNRSKMTSGEIRNPVGWVTWRIEQWCSPRIVKRDLPPGMMPIGNVFQDLHRTDR